MTFLHMEYRYFLRFSVLFGWVLKNKTKQFQYHFSGFLPISIRKSNAREVSPKLIEFLFLLLREDGGRNSHWRVRILPRAGWGCAISSLSIPQTGQVVPSPLSLASQTTGILIIKRKRRQTRGKKMLPGRCLQETSED